MITYKKIERIRHFQKTLPTIRGFIAMDSFANELKAFFGSEFDCVLKVYVHNTIDSYTEIYNDNDSAAISSFLDKQLSSDNRISTIESIMDLIEEGESYKGLKNKTETFILKVYHMFAGKIVFDSSIDEMVKKCNSKNRPLGALGDDGMLEGVLGKLKNYASGLLDKKETSRDDSNYINIYNQNNNSVNVSIDIKIEDAREKIDELGLSDTQYKEVMTKLSEIEELNKSNESKGSKWKKAKDILKWIAEQGIQVASIIVPVIGSILTKQ
ncbi:MAG: hypothetical protein IJ247_00735 [Bacilli bacterium]|nr:hypothetical protein [Bacilli bacterium]